MAGETLDDFVAHTSSRIAGLSVAHTLALRVYSTAAHADLNAPLRASGVRGTATLPHSFAPFRHPSHPSTSFHRPPLGAADKGTPGPTSRVPLWG